VTATSKKCWLAGAALLMLAAAVLWVGMDPSPTTQTTRRLFGLWRARWVVLALALVVLAVGVVLAAGGRERVFAYVTVWLALLCTAAGVELAGRTGLVSLARLAYVPEIDLGSLGTRPQPHVDVSGTTRQDMAGGWGIPAESVAFRFRTDRFGYRNEPDRAQASIYLLGDSMVVAALTPHPQTLGSQLEKRLGRPVMQIALINTGLQQQHDLFRATGLDVRGRLVLQFVFEGNDLLDSRRYSQGETGLTEERKTDRWSLFDLAWNWLSRVTEPTVGLARQRSCEIAGRNYYFAWGRNSFEGVESEVAVVGSALEAFAKQVRAAGGEFAVVFVPKKLWVLVPQCRWPASGSEFADMARHLGTFGAQLNDWSRAVGIPFFDLTGPLGAAVAAGRPVWFEADTHWNAAGQEVAAEALAAWPVVGAPAAK
jgi:SGNH hydrolase-like domain, acetyltransferase AlgX